MSGSWIVWGIVIGYLAFVFSKGVLKVRQVSNTDDFLVAGRNVGWFLLFCTMGATVVGGGASIGAIGRTYDWGVLMLIVSIGWYVHFIFAGLWVAPYFREARLYTVAGYFGHRFGEGPRFLAMVLSLLFSVFVVAAQMAAFGSVMAAIAPEFATATSVLRWAIAIGGTLVVIYSTAGGLLAVIHTDVYQFIILVIGFAVTLLFCIPDLVESYDKRTGEFVPLRFSTVDILSPEAFAEELTRADDPVARYLTRTAHLPPGSGTRQAATGAPEPTLADATSLVGMLNGALDDPRLYDPDRFAHVTLSVQTRELIAPEAQGKHLRRLNLSLIQDAFPGFISPNRSIAPSFFRLHGDKGWLFLITTFFAFLLGECFAPGYATRYCVGKNVRETRFGIVGAGVFLALFFPVVLFFISLYARIHYPAIDSQQALPRVVYQLHNPMITGLIIGALLMAVMSSADSALNSATAIFVKDLFEHQLGWNDDEKHRLLKLARLCSMALGGMSILVAILWSDIIGLLLFTYHVWAPAIIVPVCVGAFSQHRSQRQNRIVLVTMIGATAATLVYRLPHALSHYFGIRVLPEALSDLTARLDPAVFGVAVSLVLFGALTWGTGLLCGAVRTDA